MHSSNSEIECTLIVAAAGQGKRMGLSFPKQFLKYKDKPLFINVLEVGEKSNLVKNIIVVTKEDLIDEVSNLCEMYKLKKVKAIIKGGKERQESIYNALKYCSKDSIIAIQDGVRPFFKEEYLEKTIRELKNNQKLSGAIIGVPVKDTVKQLKKDKLIERTPERSTLYLAQTPQVFRGRILKEAYEKALNDNFLGTDDSSLVEKYYGNVKIIEGDYSNIKITTIEDLRFLEL
ncbi:MAG: 2-C-methyl-D-erythritol 4-phosphate cytidylyltransferase [Fusobacterium sp. JB021]|nr:2-C-methyl-D-erythritol 4-phosphate cytidylyltransferase [Fusobacterium sp. JB020]MDP0493405.1 2-C-methyl-D-erythritol 4-phosphate cytidylyltransferase [Fusobacterium sp. JB021]MDP0507639.1 2-C-methyl-D-erythritol 4-phosphate cytidylyltransferase [Fusobacterium sp. JB019]